MTDGPVTELPTINQQEKPASLKPPEVEAPNKQIEQGEQKKFPENK